MNRSDLTAQAEELEIMIATMGHLAALAAGQIAREGGEPGPQLDVHQVDASLQAVASISKAAHTLFCDLMTALKVPA